MSDIWSEKNYLSPSRYISGRIVEYDIKSANISVLRSLNIITEEDYAYLSKLPKEKREIEIGLRIRQDSSIYTNIQKGIRDAREWFFVKNQLDDDSIVRIANDAIYVNCSSNLPYTKIDNYTEFRPKSISHVYLNLNKILFFVTFLDDGNIDIDVKGIGNNMLLHQNYMISVIGYCITILERAGVIEAYRYLNDIIEKYLKLQLPVGFYRELNSESMYKLKYELTSGIYGVPTVEEYNKEYIDINFNYNILRELWSILIQKYNMRK